MRVASGKGNDAHKILTYYRVNYSIRPPYRVLCDGALIHNALSKKLYLRDALPALLKATAQAVVTRCVHEELRALGEPTEGAAMFAKRLTRVPCVHDGGTVPAVECVAAALHDRNKKGYLVATNDQGLLKLLRKEPGVPVVRIAADGKFVLVPPSKATLEQVGAMEASKAGVRRPDEVKKLEEDRQRVLERRAQRKAERATKKRKRPKGPNPLSVKKSKKPRLTKKSQDGQGEDVDGADGSDVTDADIANQPKKPKRVRKRKPKRARTEQVSPDSDDVQSAGSSPGVGEAKSAPDNVETTTPPTPPHDDARMVDSASD